MKNTLQSIVLLFVGCLLFIPDQGLAQTTTETNWHSPAEVILIRHAEKPIDGSHLSGKGRKRALALPRLFSERTEFMQNGSPVALFAARPDNADGSVRSIETLEPISENLKIEINSNFTKDEFPAMINQIMNDATLAGKTVLICWPHDQIPDIAKGFGVSHPPKWSGSTFDRAWKINFLEDGQESSFESLPQNLLPGDATEFWHGHVDSLRYGHGKAGVQQ